MSNEALEQFSWVSPPKRLGVLALAVDGTARPYDLGLLTLGKVINPVATSDYIYISMTVETASVFFHFSPTTQSDLNDATVIAAGTAISMPATSAGIIRVADAPQRFRINRITDRWLVVKCAGAGTATLRLYASSRASSMA